jgi:hypothetical protein
MGIALRRGRGGDLSIEMSKATERPRAGNVRVHSLLGELRRSWEKQRASLDEGEVALNVAMSDEDTRDDAFFSRMLSERHLTLVGN